MQLTSRPRLTVGTPVIQSPGRSQGKIFRRFLTVILFLLPAGILYLSFIFLPVFQAAYYSFFDWSGLGPLTDFVGFRNYIEAFRSSVFIEAFTHNLLLLVLSLIFQLTLSLALALTIGKTLRGRTFFRTIFFMPFILSDVVAGVIWTYIYEPSGGLLNTTLQHLIPNYQPQLWLADPKMVLLSIFVVMIWKYFGLHLVLYVAAIQDIPDEVVEAARIDGASGFQVLRYITLPLMSSIIRLTILLSAIGSLQYFDLIWVMSGGGPIHASETMTTYLYRFGFQSFAMGYGSAVGVLMFLICFIFAMLYQRFVMRQDLAGSLTGGRA
jgi:raffinose/stachyose/melibiose transport system permease protein